MKHASIGVLANYYKAGVYQRHHSCERNSWLDCMAYLFELRRNEGKWENLFRILYFMAAQHNMKSTMDAR